MKRLLAVLVVEAFIAAPAAGQSFTNLNFEQATVAAPNSPFGFLDWNATTPGWSHSSGADTTTVYYGSTHVGVTQWFLLVDSATQPTGPLSGNYSMRFVSGHESSNSASPWVNAYLAQTAVVPSFARSLTLLATGPLGISINGAPASVVSLGGSAFAVDVSAYSGTTAEIRFINTSYQYFDALTIDNIDFSASPVTEPAIWVLLCLGAALAPTLRRTPETIHFS
jgi:hypothetical protein